MGERLTKLMADGVILFTLIAVAVSMPVILLYTIIYAIGHAIWSNYHV